MNKTLVAGLPTDRHIARVHRRSPHRAQRILSPQSYRSGSNVLHPDTPPAVFCGQSHIARCSTAKWREL